MQSQNFASIQALRGIAALMVVCYHVGGQVGLIGVGVHPSEAGVDLFFVISGFVMVASTQGRDMTAAAFMRARLTRIVPLYWLALAASLAVIAVGINPRPLPALDEIAKAFAFIFYTDSHTSQPSPFLNVGWTLNYELYFYLVFALTIWLKPLAQLVTLALFFAAMVGLRKVVGGEGALAFRLTSPLPFEFLAGMALALVRHKLDRVPDYAAAAVGVIGVALIALNLGLPRTVAFGAPAAMIVAAAVMLERRYRPVAALQALGDSSYSLYLTHGLVMLCGTGLLVLPALVSAPLLVALSIAVGLTCYRFVELRLRPNNRAVRVAVGDDGRIDAEPVRVIDEQVTERPVRLC